MKGFPQELIYVLIFLGILLVQYLIKRRGSQAPPEPSQDAGVPQTPYEIPPDFAGLEQATPMVSSPSRESADRFGRPEAPAALRARPRRRFDRQSLMGTRWEVQNAVVIATIVGQCRALEPPGDAAAPTSPRCAAR
jgi:hypothetical protein